MFVYIFYIILFASARFRLPRRQDETFGFNPRTEAYVDLIEAGIIDPPRVAALIDTIEALVVELAKDKPAFTPPGGGGGF